MSAPPPGYPVHSVPYPGWAPDHPEATTVLVLGILGIVACPITAPIAWAMGNRVLREIDNSGGQYGGRGSASAGRLCGIIITWLYIALAAMFVLSMVVVIVIAAATS